MLKTNRQNYIHIYMDLSDEILYFHSTSNPYPLGKSLIDFIYMDLETFPRNPADVRSLHPFFSLWDDTQTENLFKAEEGKGVGLTFEKMRELQKVYGTLLGAVANNGSHVDEETVHYLKYHSFYSSETLICQMAEDEKRWMIDYVLVSFEDCLMCELMEMIRRRLHIKVCKNCGRLFTPKRSNIDYCIRPYSEDGKTCADVGYTKTFAKTLQQDELLQAYTRAYKAHYARMTKPRKKASNMTRDEFEDWYRKAKEGLELARQGKIRPEDYKAWLKQ